MRRSFLLILTFLFLSSVLWCSGRDIIAMVDISASMAPFFEDLRSYFVHDLLKRIRIGDTFHFLSFSSSPEAEISQVVEDQKSIEKIINKILMLEPIGLHTDLVAAVGFLTRYAKRLPADRDKIILLLTDGVHDPPPESPNRGDPDQVLQALLGNAEELKRGGWTIHILQMPGADQQQSQVDTGGIEGAGKGEGKDKSYLPDVAMALGIDMLPFSRKDSFSKIDQSISAPQSGTIGVVFPAYLGTVNSPFKATFAITSLTSQETHIDLFQVSAGEINILERTVTVNIPPGKTLHVPAVIRLPRGSPQGKQELNVTLVFDENGQKHSLTGTLSFTLSHTPVLSIGENISIPLIPLLLILAIVLIALLLIYTILKVKLPRRREGMVHPSGRRFGSFRKTGEVIEMRVRQQNPRIGVRNIHFMRPGSRLTVGGGRSHFLIFIAPIPSSIGEISYDGDDFTFVPKKKHFFPDLDAPVVSCLGKEIPALSDKGYALFLRFKRYVSPLDEINRILQNLFLIEN
ncbi:MAG TPA: vWA domain-containing protein [Spirochaetia bacterium]|nr:vWA domain-containing protein [Spirochaetia bacterium]